MHWCSGPCPQLHSLLTYLLTLGSILLSWRACKWLCYCKALYCITVAPHCEPSFHGSELQASMLVCSYSTMKVFCQQHMPQHSPECLLQLSASCNLPCQKRFETPPCAQARLAYTNSSLQVRCAHEPTSWCMSTVTADNASLFLLLPH